MIKPWEHDKPYSDEYEGFNWRLRKSYIYKRVYHTVRDSSRLNLRKGDIIKFGSGYNEYLSGWPEWFLMSREDKKKFWRRNITPFYAQNQYAIVMNRYVWKKFKRWMAYSDYGVIIMMITGPQIGHIRKYYTNRPFKIKSSYPHNEKIKGRFIKMKKPFKTINDNLFLPDFNITLFINKLEKKFGDIEEARDLFLEKICSLLEVPI
jgi:hypothetical protein